MKKLLFIFVILIYGCTKMDDIEPIAPPVEKIFDVKQSSVTNGQSIHFDLPAEGVYTLTLIDTETGQVVSRERFTGKYGENVKKIYTNSIQNQYLYLLLEDVTRKELGKTIIKIR